MKLLFDTCVWAGERDGVVNAGHDAVWATDWGKDPGDEDILARAFREKRILITLDKDFGELAIIKNMPHCGILRLVNIRAAQQMVVCLKVLDRYGKDLKEGAIITAYKDRVRIRPPAK